MPRITLTTTLNILLRNLTIIIATIIAILAEHNPDILSVQLCLRYHIAVLLFLLRTLIYVGIRHPYLRMGGIIGSFLVFPALGWIVINFQYIPGQFYFIFYLRIVLPHGRCQCRLRFLLSLFPGLRHIECAQYFLLLLALGVRHQR